MVSLYNTCCIYPSRVIPGGRSLCSEVNRAVLYAFGRIKGALYPERARAATHRDHLDAEAFESTDFFKAGRKKKTPE